MLLSTGMPSFVRADLHAELMKATGAKLELENDANAAAYGEFKVGAAAMRADFFYIYIGDTVGGALHRRRKTLDRRVWVRRRNRPHDDQSGRHSVRVRQHWVPGNGGLSAKYRCGGRANV